MDYEDDVGEYMMLKDSVSVNAFKCHCTSASALNRFSYNFERNHISSVINTFYICFDRYASIQMRKITYEKI